MPDFGPVTAQLKALRERAGLTVRATAEALDMPASSYAVYEDGKRYKKGLIPVPLAQKLADLFEQHDVKREMVMRLAGLDVGGDIIRTPEAMAEQLDAVLLPEVEVGYSMGGGADISDFPVVQQVPFSRSWLASLTDSPPSQLFVARGEGDSMMPTILDGDIVIIDRGQKTMRQQDRIWALVYGGFGMIKRLRGLPNGTLQINSDNPAVTPIEAYDGEAFIIGRIVAIVRRM
jgi:phage repressor protein C with HTH and peptisase S24 domain